MTQLVVLTESSSHLQACLLSFVQIIQQHVVPDRALTEFSISNNQKLDTLLAGSPLTVSVLAAGYCQLPPAELHTVCHLSAKLPIVRPEPQALALSCCRR